MKPRLSPRERYISAIAAAIVICAAVYNFIFEPFIAEWKGLNSEIELKKIRFIRNVKLLKEGDSIVKEYNAYKGPRLDLSNILDYIETQARTSGVKISNIRPRPVEQKELYKEYTAEIQIEGDFSAIDDFLSSIIKSRLFTSIKKFDFRMLEPDSSSLKGTLVLARLIL